MQLTCEIDNNNFLPLLGILVKHNVEINYWIITYLENLFKTIWFVLRLCAM